MAIVIYCILPVSRNNNSRKLHDLYNSVPHTPDGDPALGVTTLFHHQAGVTNNPLQLQAESAMVKFCGIFSLKLPEVNDVKTALKKAYVTKFSALFLKALESEVGKPETRKMVSNVLSESKKYECCEEDFPSVLWAKVQGALKYRAAFPANVKP
eukprot:1728616-Amphidinium_carterae.2